MVSGCVGGVIADLILDTGADMSICRASLIPEGKFRKGVPVHLTGFGASGAFYPTAYVPVEVGHVQFVAVVPDHLITAGALLGADLGDTVIELQKPNPKSPVKITAEVEEDDWMSNIHVDGLADEREKADAGGEEEVVERGEAEDDDWQAEEDEQLVRIPLVEEDENVKRDFIKALVEDESLKFLKEKAVKKVDGYRWMRGLLKRLVTDEWGRPRELLVIPNILGTNFLD